MCIHLLSTINSDYMVPFKVTVHSLISTKSPATRVRWHLCNTGLSAHEKEEIETQFADSSVEFVWHVLSVTATASLPARGRAVPKMYERLFVPNLLAGETERFIYLDGDLLILDRIEELWDVELDGAILGAVQDLAVPLVSSPMGLARFEELGLAETSPYFNAGVYLVDVEAWQTNQISHLSMEYLDCYRKSVNLMDQDALNAAIQGRWKPLDYRWNLAAGLAARAHFQPQGLDVSRLDQAIANPGILHFSGYLKPWIYPRLGSRWASAYENVLFEVYPDHQLDQTIKGHAFSYYDRKLRTLLYPLENFAWKTMKGF